MAARRRKSPFCALTGASGPSGYQRSPSSIETLGTQWRQQRLQGTSLLGEHFFPALILTCSAKHYFTLPAGAKTHSRGRSSTQDPSAARSENDFLWQSAWESSILRFCSRKKGTGKFPFQVANISQCCANLFIYIKNPGTSRSVPCRTSPWICPSLPAGTSSSLTTCQCWPIWRTFRVS